VQRGGIDVELVEERVALGDRELTVVHPRRPDELIDEEAFASDEFLPYWAELWPSGVVLARAVAPLVRPGDAVVELGCGLALPSIAAALAGGRVLATDWSPDGLLFAAANAARNGVRIETALVPWSTPDELVMRGPWDWVLAADLLYENRNVLLLASLLPRLVGDRGRVLLADPGRPAARDFFAAVSDWDVEPKPRDTAHPRVGLHALRPRRASIGSA
jgi:predicted nicotinamide N-methyase